MIKIGVTGSRHGIQTVEQFDTIYSFLRDNHPGELHHGDCQGVDHEVAVIARELGYVIVSHPPESKSLRVFHDSDIVHPAKPYLDRNRDIVDSVDVMLVVPYEDSSQYKGGTWYTYRYAKSKQVPTLLITPSNPLGIGNLKQ